MKLGRPQAVGVPHNDAADNTDNGYPERQLDVGSDDSSGDYSYDTCNPMRPGSISRPTCIAQSGR